MSSNRDYAAIGSNLKDGEVAEFYDKKPGLFGRTFQLPDVTVEKSADRIQVYEKEPGIFGRTFQVPDQEIVIRKK